MEWENHNQIFTQELYNKAKRSCTLVMHGRKICYMQGIQYQVNRSCTSFNLQVTQVTVCGADVDFAV